MGLQVFFLGPLHLNTSDGRTITLGGIRLRTLLARLALDAGRYVPVDTLIDDQWGSAPPSDASNALQSLVSRLRRALGDTPLESGPAGYRLALRPDDVDVVRFDRLASQGRAQLRSGAAGPALATLTEALAMWQGDALADLGDAPFVAPVAARLAEARLSATEDRLAAELALGRFVDIVPELDELAARHPLRERLAALRLRALHGAGRTADALAGYQAVRVALAEELGVAPGAELREAHLAVLRDEQPKIAPPRPARTTLPPRLTSFVGREVELTRLATLLAGTRLVSLVGPGGAGKTRLGTELAADLLTRQPDRPVWFVELAPVGERAELAELIQAVIGALHLREIRITDTPVPPRPALDRLTDLFNGGRPGLLILDNCEHLIEVAAELVALLFTHCPTLTVLVTSREPLAITGETLHRVGPLDLPAERVSVEVAGTVPSVRLFLDRAEAAQPGFALDPANLAAVTEICRRLDGMPLALELAAARLRSMPVRQIAEHLDDRFRLLSAGSRAALPRHRTLHGVVRWSWELLTEPERTLASRLALLAGGADLAAAVGVCADADVPAADVPYLLASLVEKSLLAVAEGADGQPRYRMLETVRAYGLAELAESGAADRVGAAFVGYFLELAERVEPLFRTAEQISAMTELGLEHDNILAAIRRAVDTGDAESAARLAAAMGWYWLLTGTDEEAAAWFNAIAALPAAQPTQALVAIRFGALVQGDPPAEAELAEVLAQCAELDVLTRYPALLIFEPVMRMTRGEFELARASARRARDSADPWVRACGQLAEGMLVALLGDAGAAETLLTEALAGFQAVGDRWGSAFALTTVGQYRILRGDHEGALAAMREAVELAVELGATETPPMQLVQLAQAEFCAGELDSAERDLRAVLVTSTATAVDELSIMANCVLVRVLAAKGELAQAREVLAMVLATEPPIEPAGFIQRFAVIRMVVAELAIAEGDLDRADAALAECLAMATHTTDMTALAAIGDGVARLRWLHGEPDRAAELFGAAARLRGLPDLGDPATRRMLAGLHAELGADGYTAAYERGFQLDPAAAMAAIGVS